MKNFTEYFKQLNEAEPVAETPEFPTTKINSPDAGQLSSNQGIMPVPGQDDKKTVENEKKEKEKHKKEKMERKFIEARQKLIDKYMDENKDTSWIVLKPVKNTVDAILPLFTIDISMDPYLDKRKFELGKIEKKIDDQLDYNEIFIKDIEHMAGKLGIETIIWKTDSHGSKYFKISFSA
jgi:hypothetical protein